MCERTYRRFLYLLLSGVVCLIYGSLKYDWNEERENSQPDSTVVMNQPAMSQYVYPSGEPIGIYVKTDGVMVIGITGVEQTDGSMLVPCDGKLKQGDYILAINDEEVTSKRKMIEILKGCQDENMHIKLRRDNEELAVDVKAVMGGNNQYLLGLWVKDDISGIGTLTYVSEDSFGALGHSINDNDTGALFTISDGAIYGAKILHIKKPTQGAPGRLEGMINYANSNIIGRVNGNKNSGIQGYLTESAKELYMDEEERIPIAKPEEVHIGDAYIVSALTGERTYYAITILNLDWSANDAKRMEIKVIDEKLLDVTGGIVQGMSGSPIVQDGKLIGAVTHVFVNDATKGYGIYIGDMVQ